MGAAKVGLRFGHEYLLQRVVRIVSQVASPLVLASHHGVQIPLVTPPLPIVFDDSDDAGPLAGIASGMKAFRDRCDAVLVIPCDHPFLKVEVLHRMIQFLNDHSAVVPELGGELFATLAVYRPHTLVILEEMLRRRRFRAQEFARQCNPLLLRGRDLTDIDPELDSFRNMNTPAEYDAALLAGQSGLPKGFTCAL